MYIYKKYKAFTLVELIVVITILTILWTIAMMYYQSYIIDTRNTVRITDLNNMKKVLDINIITKWDVPNPSNYYTISYSWSELWKQGTFWKSVIKDLWWSMSEAPLDPSSWLKYDYSITKNNSKIEYSLGYIEEWWNPIAKNSNIIKQAYAWNKKGKYNVIWNYNWFFLQTNTWWIDYIIAVPEIMKVSTWSQDYFDVLDKNELVVPGFSNLPERYKEIWYNSTWSLETSDFLNKEFIIVYKWNKKNLYFWDWIIEFGQKLQYAYDYTKLKEITKYKDIIDFDPLHYFTKTKDTFWTLIRILWLNVNLADYFEKWYTKYAVENLYKLTEIQSNKITSVLHDNWKMWFGTNWWWIMTYDINNNKRWTYNSAISDDFPDTINNILKDNSGKIWFTTYWKWIRIYNPTTDTWETKNTSNSSLWSNYTYWIFQDSNNNIWIWYLWWVNKYNSLTDTWTNYSYADIWITARPIWNIIEDNNWNIYVTNWFWNWWISKFNWTSWINYNMKDLWISTTNNWHWLFKNNDWKLWFGTRGNYVNVYDPSVWNIDNPWAWYKDTNSPWVTTNWFIDSTNNLWVWDRSSIWKYNSTTNVWKKYTSNPQYTISLISGIAEDNDWNMWFWSSYRWIWKLDKNSDEFSWYVKKERLWWNNIYKLFADNDWFLWVWINSTENLYKYEILKDKWSEYKAWWAAIQDIIYDNNNILWFTTLWGICKKNNDETFSCYKTSDWLKSNYTWKIAVDSVNNIWISYGRGRHYWISKFNQTTWNIVHYNVDNSDLSTNRIYNIFVDSNDNVWLATNDWVNMLDSSWNWSHYTTSNSNLSYDLVYDIYEDSHWIIWVVAWHDLNKFNPVTKEFTTVYNSRFQTSFEDKNNNMRFWTWTWLLKYTRNTWEYKEYGSDKLWFWRITTITQDKNWVIWYGNRWNWFWRLNQE